MSCPKLVKINRTPVLYIHQYGNQKSSLKIQYSTNDFLAAKFEKWAHIWCQLITKSDLIADINFRKRNSTTKITLTLNMQIWKYENLFVSQIQDSQLRNNWLYHQWYHSFWDENTYYRIQHPSLRLVEIFRVLRGIFQMRLLRLKVLLNILCL